MTDFYWSDLLRKIDTLLRDFGAGTWMFWAVLYNRGKILLAFAMLNNGLYINLKHKNTGKIPI